MNFLCLHCQVSKVCANTFIVYIDLYIQNVQENVKSLTSSKLLHRLYVYVYILHLSMMATKKPPTISSTQFLNSLKWNVGVLSQVVWRQLSFSLRDSRLSVNGGSNLYNMKTNLHPFDGECCHWMRTITALDKLRLRDISGSEIQSELTGPVWQMSMWWNNYQDEDSKLIQALVHLTLYQMGSLFQPWHKANLLNSNQGHGYDATLSKEDIWCIVPHWYSDELLCVHKLMFNFKEDCKNTHHTRQPKIT